MKSLSSDLILEFWSPTPSLGILESKTQIWSFGILHPDLESHTQSWGSGVLEELLCKEVRDYSSQTVEPV